jgi:hypothetical protein
LIVLTLFVRAGFAAPTLTRVTPSSGVHGATLNLTITGTEFTNTSTEVRFSGSGVVVNGVRFESTTSIVANVTLLGDPGLRTIALVSGGTTSNSIPFEILASPLSTPQTAAVVNHFTGPEGGIGSTDGSGTEARFYQPGGIWSDGTNLYVSDRSLHTIRKISIATRNVTTLAGAPWESGAVDGVGANARFNNPDAIWGDGSNLYVADFFGCVIRKVTISTGEVTTVAGSRNQCDTVDGTADVARFRNVDAIWGDGAFLYAAERGRAPIRFEPPLPASIRVISLTTGEVRTIPVPFYQATIFGVLHPLGIWGIDGFLYTTWFSSAGSLVMARINVITHEIEWMFNSRMSPCCSGFFPAGLWFDGRGNFYFLEGRTLRRLVLATGELTSIAEVPQASYNSPARIWGVGDNIYVTDWQAAIVSRVHIPTRLVSVFAGLHSNAPPFDQNLNAHIIKSIAGDGRNVYVIIDNNILKLESGTNTPTVFVSSLNEPSSLWSDATYLYAVAYQSNYEIHRIALSSGQTTLLASGFANPRQLWGDSTYLYVGDGSVIKRVAKATGEVAIFAGSAAESGSADGVGTAARFRRPFGIWGDGTYLYVTDPADKTIRRIRISTAEVTTFAGAPGSTGPLDGIGTNARFSGDGPSNISGDGTNLYVSDGFIRRISISTAEVSTFLDLPGYPLWSDSRYLYAGNQPPNEAVLNRITLSTREVSRIFPPLQFSEGVIPSDRLPVNISWGDGEFLYGMYGQALYKVSMATGQIIHVAGVFDEAGRVDGVGNSARFASPLAIWGDGTYLYVIDRVSIRRVNIANREVSTIRGSFFSSDVWGDGRYLYFPYFRTIERVSISTGEIVRLAGDPGTINVFQFADGTGTAARFEELGPMWGDGTNLYVGDACSIRKVAIATAEVTTLAGIADICVHVDGARDTARFNTVADLWGNSRFLFVSTRYSIRTVDLATGEVKTIAGHPVRIGTENGSALDARFLGPRRIWGDGVSLYISDNGIRKMTFAAAAHSYSISSSGADYLATPAGAGSMTIGYARVQASAGSTTPDGVAIFSYRSNGVLVSETAVPASPLIQQGRIFAETGGAVNTGIAIANPNDQSATVSFYFTDANGVTFGSGTTTIAANQQIAAFLNEAPFNGAANARSFTFTSSLAVGAIALRGYTNERSEFLMTTLPVAPITSSSSNPIVLPHFAAGGGWTTQVLLVNPTDGPISGSVDMDTTYNYSIAPRSAVKIVSSGSSSQIRAGSVRISPAVLMRSPVASTVFSFVSGGITVTESGVATTGTAQSFRIFAEFDSARSMQTGVAIANTSSTAAAVQFELLDLKGQLPGYSGSSTIAANGHVSLFLNELPGFQNLPATFRGVLRVSSNALISAIGLRGRYNERGEFLIATTPALADNSPANTAELVFPHIVSGGGYKTEFLLMSGGSTSAGTLLLRSQSGAELQLPLSR